jgi:selenide, water dikinase
LAAALEKLPPQPFDPRVLVGYNTADDAGVFQLSDELALVQTVDFFTPIVDDPFMYGQISAANSLSDIYAMGGKPLTALNIVGFPKNIFPLDVLAEILRGGQEKAQEAGAVILGGHTIGDDELKYGLAVTGVVHPAHILTNAAAHPGDVLILTKAIGVGTITTALKAGKAEDEWIIRISRQMVMLNKAAAEACLAVGVHAVTDISGFGLLGHALEMAQASRVGMQLDFLAIPIIAEAVITTAAGFVPGGTKANHLFSAPSVEYAEHLSREQQWLLNDPQTSGGLLIAVAAEKAPELQRRLGDAGVIHPIIGLVTAGFPNKIIVK